MTETLKPLGWATAKYGSVWHRPHAGSYLSLCGVRVVDSGRMDGSAKPPETTMQCQRCRTIAEKR